MAEPVLKILRKGELRAKLGGTSTSSIYAMMDSADFPRPIRLTLRRVGWIESEVDSWLRDRIERTRSQSKQPARTRVR